MKTCCTCTHWTEEAPYEMKDGYVQRRCASPKLQEDYYDAAPDALCYSYQEGGSFWPGPDFGCVHHKDKEPAMKK